MEKRYEIAIGQNGFKYVLKESVNGDVLTLPFNTNSKIGKAMSFSQSIEYTCDHRCECYQLGDFYGCHGCYVFGNNQAKYTDNYKFFMKHGKAVFVKTVVAAIKDGDVKRFRWFGVGDITNPEFLEAMVEIAEQCPGCKFWGYTKKYRIVNHWLDTHNGFPVNLTVIFSHWMNRDGSYFPMENPHNLPTSEFVPFGMEHVIDLEHGHVCPCSDPDFIGTCEQCETPCCNLGNGDHMYLLQHSTGDAKERDREIKAARKARREALKANLDRIA